MLCFWNMNKKKELEITERLQSLKQFKHTNFTALWGKEKLSKNERREKLEEGFSVRWQENVVLWLCALYAKHTCLTITMLQ